MRSFVLRYSVCLLCWYKSTHTDAPFVVRTGSRFLAEQVLLSLLALLVQKVHILTQKRYAAEQWSETIARVIAEYQVFT